MSNSFRRNEELSAESRRASLLSAVKQVTSLFSWAGRYFLLLALGMLLVGLFRRVNLLLLLGDAFLVIAVLNLLAAGGDLRRLQGRLRFSEWLFARTPFTVDVHVSNPDRQGLSGLRLETEGPKRADAPNEPVDGRPARAARAATWLVSWLPNQGKMSWQRQVTVPRRGRYTWGPVRAVSGYPFGLVERRAVLVPEETLMVLPSVGWLHRGRFVRHLRGLSVKPQQTRHHPPRRHPAAQAEFHGLRLYQTGDSPRLIHWRTSARRGELMVREFEDEQSDNLLLVLDPTLPAASDHGGVPQREQFEEVVSLTATICWEWCRRRGDRLILATGGAEPVVLDGLTGPVHARRVLECLAAVECQTGPANAGVLTSLPMHRLPSAIVVIIALGRSALTDPLAHALRRRVNVVDATRTDRFDFYTPPG
jgi:uncharacterized protein (DUF58 family)